MNTKTYYKKTNTVFAVSSLNIISKFTPRFFYLKNNDPLQV